MGLLPLSSLLWPHIPSSEGFQGCSHRSFNSLSPLLRATCQAWPLLTGSQYLGPEKTQLKATKSSLTPCHLPLAPVLPLLSSPFPFKALSSKARWEGSMSAFSLSFFTSHHVPGHCWFPLGCPFCSQPISLVKSFFCSFILAFVKSLCLF